MKTMCVHIYMFSLYVLYILYVCIEISVFDTDILKRDVRGLLPQVHCNTRIAETVPGINQEQVTSCICPMFVNV